MDILFGETPFVSLHLKNYQNFKGGTRPLVCKNRIEKITEFVL
mgnify:CR=1 FL=1